MLFFIINFFVKLLLSLFIYSVYKPETDSRTQIGKYKCHNGNWNSDYLYYTVREPYPSKWTSAEMVLGEIKKNCTFKIQSLMPDNGVIFSDDIESDYL